MNGFLMAQSQEHVKRKTRQIGKITGANSSFWLAARPNRFAHSRYLPKTMEGISVTCASPSKPKLLSCGHDALLMILVLSACMSNATYTNNHNVEKIVTAQFRHGFNFVRWSFPPVQNLILTTNHSLSYTRDLAVFRFIPAVTIHTPTTHHEGEKTQG